MSVPQIQNGVICEENKENENRNDSKKNKQPLPGEKKKDKGKEKVVEEEEETKESSEEMTEKEREALPHLFHEMRNAFNGLVNSVEYMGISDDPNSPLILEYVATNRSQNASDGYDIKKQLYILVKLFETIEAKTVKRTLRRSHLRELTAAMRTWLNALPGDISNEIFQLSRELFEQLLKDYKKLQDRGNQQEEQEIFSLQYSAFSLSHVMRTLPSFSAQQTGVEFSYKIAEEVPLRVYSDEARLRQILTNLITNAFKFTKSGSVRVDISLDRTGTNLVIAVADTGRGIPPDADVFSAFSQINPELSPSGHTGLGLGLEIVKTLVEALRGKIEMASVVGKGTTFTITLPLQAPTT